MVEFDSLINFLDDYILDLNYARSDTQEGNINFIGNDDTFAGRTYAMDGESFSGTAKNIRLRRAVNGHMQELDLKMFPQLTERMLALLEEMIIKVEIIGMEEPIGLKEH